MKEIASVIQNVVVSAVWLHSGQALPPFVVKECHIILTRHEYFQASVTIIPSKVYQVYIPPLVGAPWQKHPSTKI